MSIPEDEVSIPEDEVSIPEDEVSIPEDEVSIPEDEVSIPEDEMSIPEAPVSKKPKVKPTSEDISRLLSDRPKLSPHPLQTTMLQSLKTAKRETLSSELDFIQFTPDPQTPDIFMDVELPSSMLYVRRFYDLLFETMWNTRHSVLTGNPGVSKSWFQLFILYKLVNPNEAVRRFQDLEPPVLVVRQIGKTKLLLYHLEECVVSQLDSTPVGLLMDLFPAEHILYLVEPERYGGEPVKAPCVQTIITCSPNQSRYKEFVKDGATKFYMPVWTLSELKDVAASIVARATAGQCRGTPALVQAFTNEEVCSRFGQFGGIIRYVLPITEGTVENATRGQRLALESVDVYNVLCRSPDVEVRDDLKQNVSHFVLKYEVSQSDKPFRSFTMDYTSDMSRTKVLERLHTVDLKTFHKSIGELRMMLLSGSEEGRPFYQLMVKVALQKKQDLMSFRSKDGDAWTEKQFALTESDVLAKGEEDHRSLSQNTLYAFADPSFPLIDFIFMQDDIVCGVQVTVSKTHEKKLSVYKKATERLQLDLEKTKKMLIYMVPNPKHAVLYSNRTPKQYIQGNTKEAVTKDELYQWVCKNVEFITLRVHFSF